ncbi:hypothetical protein JCM14469_24320 [Desulfatiferula olefinivorans]
MHLDSVANQSTNGYVRSSILSSRNADLKWDRIAQLWTLGNDVFNDFTAILHAYPGKIIMLSGTNTDFRDRAANDNGTISSMPNNDFAEAFTRVMILGNGNVGIGTTAPTCKLDVNGKIRAEEIKVETVAADTVTLKNESWADYVFKDDYILKPLAEVESFIRENKHLPEVPSAEEIKDKGLNMSEMMAIQMKKIEELTLHVIEQEKRMANMKQAFERDRQRFSEEIYDLKKRLIQ